MNEDYTQPLASTARNGHLNMVKYLTEHKSIKCPNYKPIIEAAVSNNLIEILKFLLRKIDIESYYIMILIKATQNGALQVVTLELDKKVLKDKKDNYRRH